MILQERIAVTSSRSIIHVGNFTCRIEGDAPTSELRGQLCYRDPVAAKFLRTGKWGQAVDKELRALEEAAEHRSIAGDMGAVSSRSRRLKDTKEAANVVYLYDAASRTFPVTLLTSVLRIMRECGFRCRLVDDTVLPPPMLKVKFHPNGHESREYQDRAVAVGLHCRKGVFAMATNSGKTDVLLRVIAGRRVKTLILVQQQESLFQTHEAIRKHLKYRSGLVGAGEFSLRPITVAIINSAHSRIEELKRYGFDAIFLNESHHGASRVHFTVLKELEPYVTYGLTGTDFRNIRSENIILRAALGNTFFRIDNQFMVEHGYSAKIRAEVLDCYQKLHPNFSWHRVYEQAIVLSGKRARLIVNAVACHARAGRTVLLLVDEVGHGQTLRNMLASKGVNVRFMHGSKGREERISARLDFKDRKFQVLCGTVFSEDIDFPTLDVVAFAGGKKAKGKVLQRLGRGQRKGYYADGTRKDVAIVIDVFDHGHRLLMKHSLRRLLAMHGAGVELPEEYVETLKKEGLVDAEPE